MNQKVFSLLMTIGIKKRFRKIMLKALTPTGPFCDRYRESEEELRFLENVEEVIKSYYEDAERYRFLRDEENWGEDSGSDSWSALGESSMCTFDEIVDSRMSKVKEEESEI